MVGYPSLFTAMLPKQVVILARTVDEAFVAQWLTSLRALGYDVEWMTEATFTPGQYVRFHGDPIVMVVWCGRKVPGWLGWFAATAWDESLRLVSTPVHADEWAADDPPFLKVSPTIVAFDENGRLNHDIVGAWFGTERPIERPPIQPRPRRRHASR